MFFLRSTFTVRCNRTQKVGKMIRAEPLVSWRRFHEHGPHEHRGDASQATIPGNSTVLSLVEGTRGKGSDPQSRQAPREIAQSG